jgi:ADP-ribose pyrophosphatase YjhB (NUDIX family)
MRATHARFTATAGGIVFDEEKRVLLLKHRFRPGGGWGLPGGFLQAGEQPEAALRRELMEEVGLEPETVELFKVRVFARPGQIEVVFRCQARGGGSPRSVEVSEMRWFAFQDLPQSLPEDQRRLIRQAADEDHRTESR